MGKDIETAAGKKSKYAPNAGRELCMRVLQSYGALTETMAFFTQFQVLSM